MGSICQHNMSANLISARMNKPRAYRTGGDKNIAHLYGLERRQEAARQQAFRDASSEVWKGVLDEKLEKLKEEARVSGRLPPEGANSRQWRAQMGNNRQNPAYPPPSNNSSHAAPPPSAGGGRTLGRAPADKFGTMSARNTTLPDPSIARAI